MKDTKTPDTTIAETITLFSHDAKNTLTSLQSFAYLLYRKAGNPADETLTQYIKKISSKVLVLTTQINQLADYARLRSSVLELQLEKVKLEEFLLQQKDAVLSVTNVKDIIVSSPQHIEVSVDKVRIAYCLLLAIQEQMAIQKSTIITFKISVSNTIDISIASADNTERRLSLQHPAFHFIQHIMTLHNGSLSITKDNSVIFHFPPSIT